MTQQSSQPQMIELKRNEAMNRAIARAKNARPKVKPVDVAARVYEVKGSKGDVYTVRFAVNGNRRFASCSCKGGQAGMVCYHIASAAAVNIGLQGMRKAAEQSAAELTRVTYLNPTTGAVLTFITEKPERDIEAHRRLGNVIERVEAIERHGYGWRVVDNAERSATSH